MSSATPAVSLYLTNACQLTCTYCCYKYIKDAVVSCSFSKKGIRLVAQWLQKNKIKNIRLIGGEPTQHKDLAYIVRTLHDSKCNIFLFTNGLFNNKTLRMLASFSGKLSIVWNINASAVYSHKQKTTILKNLQILSLCHPATLSINIDHPHYRNAFLKKIANTLALKACRIAIAHPIAKQQASHRHIRYETHTPLEKYRTLIPALQRTLHSLPTTLPVIIECGVPPCITKSPSIRKELSIRNSTVMPCDPGLVIYPNLRYSSCSTVFSEKAISPTSTIPLLDIRHLPKNLPCSCSCTYITQCRKQVCRIFTGT